MNSYLTSEFLPRYQFKTELMNLLLEISDGNSGGNIPGTARTLTV